MEKLKVIQLSEQEYKSDTGSYVLFEDRFSFSFLKIIIKGIALKCSWNSKTILPSFQVIEEQSMIFIGVDMYILGFNYDEKKITFLINCDSNFKWFEKTPNGIAAITESEVILLNVSSRCSLSGFYAFSDIIMGTEIMNRKIRVSLLSTSDRYVNV